MEYTVVARQRIFVPLQAILLAVLYSHFDISLVPAPYLENEIRCKACVKTSIPLKK